MKGFEAKQVGWVYVKKLHGYLPLVRLTLDGEFIGFEVELSPFIPFETQYVVQ